jgi:predicted phage tail protein
VTPPNSIRRIIILNPFDRSQRTVEDLELSDGMTPLATFIEEKDGQQIITVVNGEVIPPGQRALRLLRPNDSLVIAPVLQGGGGGGNKGILRMIAMIAVLAASILVPAFLVAAGTIAAGGMAAALIGASIAIGGALIVNAVLPATQPKAQQDTAIYGWNGPQMTARQGLVINKGYGIFGESPNVISSYVYTAQDKQYMNLLCSFGWGPGRSITQIKINDNPLENYKGVQVEKRLGFNEQDPISFFRDVVNEFPQSTKIRVDGGSFTVNGHGTDTEAAEIEVNYPKGLWAGPNSDGSYDPWTVFYKVEYSLHGSGVFTTALSPRVTADAGGTPQWLAIVQDQFSGGPGNIIVVATSNNDDHNEGDPGPDITSVIPFDPFGSVQSTETRHFRSVWTRNHLNDPNNVASTPGAPVKTVTNWSQITDSVTGRATTIIRHVTRINFPSAGQWDLRITKLGSGQNTSVPTPHDNDSTRRGEEMWLTSIREFAHDALAYPNQILLGIRALATDQLSGSGINITAVVDHGDPESLGYKHCVANDRPQAYYRLNESSGTVCNDSSGRGNNATYSGTGITLQQPGLINQSVNLAAAFDGAAGTKITTPAFPLGTDYCIDMWLSPTAFPSVSCQLAGNSGSGDGLYLMSDGRLVLFYGINHFSAQSITLNQPNHVAVIVKGGAVQFVINGKLDANIYGSATSLTVDNLLGKAFGSGSFHGTADEIGIYAPSIDITRFVTRYRFGISQRNKMEDFTGDQPAACSFDALCNPLYGGGIDPDQFVDIDSFVDWSNRCNELVDDGAGGTMFRHSFNAVFDTTGNLQDGLDKISVMGRARVLQVGGRKYTAIQDKPGTPVQLFGMGSIVKGSFKETWLALADRANSVDVQFSNSADTYKRDLVTVQDQAQVAADGVVPATTLDLFGAVTEAECWHAGNYQLASTKLLRRAVQFDADVEAIALVMGDLFFFSHDVPQWGQSGRIDGSVDASHVTLDQQVTMDPAKFYQLLCQLPTVKRYTGNITSIIGLRVFISGWANTARVMRLKQGAVDVEVTNSGAGFVDVASAVGLSAASADLWDEDVIETLNVVNTGNTTAALQTTSPFSAQPVQFDLYAFGEVNNNVKTFRCSRLQRKTDQHFTIYGLEYNPAVYTDGVPILPTGGDPKPVIDASNLVADETFDLVGERWQDYLRVGWRPGGLAVGADIYVSINGGVEKFYGTVQAASSVLIKTAVGQTVLARVVGFDAKDNRANYNTSPSISRLMTGVTTNLLINSTFNGSLARWDVNWRAGDNVQRQTLEGEGFIQYNVVSTTLAAAQKIHSQLTIDPTKWAVGNFIMLSGMFTGGGSATGNFALEIVFNGAGTTVRAEYNLNTATPGGLPVRINTPANTQVPGGTTSIDVIVRIRDGGSGVSVPAGTVIKFDHLLLEIVADSSVSVPSKWADNVDNGTNAANTLTGDANALAHAGSVAPVVSGQFAVTVTDTQATVAWTGMKLKWGAGAGGFVTNVQDGTYVITGLTGSLAYTEVPYYDIGTSGAIKNIEGFTNSHGSPAGAYNPSPTTDAIQAQMLKGRVPMGTVSFTMNAPGNTTGTNSTDGGSGGRIVGNHGFPQ